jgi:hypothetical protein
MNLNDAQKKQVADWIEAGLKLSEIQSKLEKEFGLRPTYMEVRFLVDDLKLTPKDPEPVKEPVLAQPPDATSPGAPPPSGKSPSDPLSKSPGGVSVRVDQVARPGALVSGKVTFSDGNQAEWQLDQMGRLGLIPEKPGYKPPANDLQTFQMELQNELARLGF